MKEDGHVQEIIEKVEGCLGFIYDEELECRKKLEEDMRWIIKELSLTKTLVARMENHIFMLYSECCVEVDDPMYDKVLGL